MNKEDLEEAAKEQAKRQGSTGVFESVEIRGFLAGAKYTQPEIQQWKEAWIKSENQVIALQNEIEALKAKGLSLIPKINEAIQHDLKQTRLEGAREGYIQGFTDSGEGFNGEYPFQDKGKNPLDDNDFVRNLNIFLKSLEAKDE